MRRSSFLFILSGICLALVSLQTRSGEGKETKSALEADPKGWLDLLAGGMKDWKRVPIPPGSKLSAKDPWTLDTAGGTLHCDGVGVHEMLLSDRPFDDGTLHVEWKFQKVEGKKGYNSGVYVRNSADGAVWHQAQVGSLNVGYLFGNTLVGDKQERFRTKSTVPQRGREAGEWNTYEVTCKGKTLTLWVNGGVTSEWDACEVPRGHVGLEAEGFVIDFKNVKFKPAK